MKPFVEALACYTLKWASRNDLIHPLWESHCRLSSQRRTGAWLYYSDAPKHYFSGAMAKKYDAVSAEECVDYRIKATVHLVVVSKDRIDRTMCYFKHAMM